MSVLDVVKPRGTQSAIEKVERLVTNLETRLAQAREDLAAATDAVAFAGLPDGEDEKAIGAAAKRMRATLESRRADVLDAETMLTAARHRLTAERRKAEQDELEARWDGVAKAAAKRRQAAEKLAGALAEAAVLWRDTAAHTAEMLRLAKAGEPLPRETLDVGSPNDLLHAIKLEATRQGLPLVVAPWGADAAPGLLDYIDRDTGVLMKHRPRVA